ncbi:hypothetical protein D3C74_333800 [compost metagenome]
MLGDVGATVVGEARELAPALSRDGHEALVLEQAQRGVDRTGARTPRTRGTLTDLLDDLVAVHGRLGQEEQDGSADVAAPGAAARAASSGTAVAARAAARSAAVPTGPASFEPVVEPLVGSVVVVVLMVARVTAVAVGTTPGTARALGPATGRVATSWLTTAGAVGSAAAATARAAEVGTEVRAEALSGGGEVVASATGSAPEGVEGACAAGTVAGRAGSIWVLVGGTHVVSPVMSRACLGSPFAGRPSAGLGWRVPAGSRRFSDGPSA